tara:strand:+ start:1024 stop:1545 length:522 start_codon:yes stop_codon:yes gene_type:complete
MKSLILFFGKLTLEKKTLLLTLTPILTVLLNTQSMLIGLALIIFIDLLTGIRKSHYKEGIKFTPFTMKFWNVIKSKHLRSTWRKTYEYGMGIVVFAVFESMVLKLDSFTIGTAVFTLTELAVITAVLVEMYSIFENMEAVSGNNLLKRLSFLLPVQIRRLLLNKEKKEEGTGN